MDNRPTSHNASSNRLVAGQSSIGYDYIKNLNLSAVNFVPADENVRILELHCKSEGTVRIETEFGGLANLLFSDYDIKQGEFTSINRAGTDAGLQTGEITAFGFRIQEST